jgi:DNA repair protein RadC
LMRASLLNLLRFLPQAKAARLIAALRLGTLACQDTLTQQHFDTPERVYNAFGLEMRVFDREVLAVILLNTRFRLIKFEKLRRGTVNGLLRIHGKFSNPPSFIPRMPSFSYTTTPAETRPPVTRTYA